MDDSDKCSNTDSDDDSEDGTLSRKSLYVFNRQCCVIESDFLIIAWFFCVLPEVRKDVADCSIGIHQNTAERDITKIFLYDVDSNMGQVISDFWDEKKHFRKQTGMYSDHYQWKSPDVDKGNSLVWYEQY